MHHYYHARRIGLPVVAISAFLFMIWNIIILPPHPLPTTENAPSASSSVMNPTTKKTRKHGKTIGQPYTPQSPTTQATKVLFYGSPQGMNVNWVVLTGCPVTPRHRNSKNLHHKPDTDGQCGYFPKCTFDMEFATINTTNSSEKFRTADVIVSFPTDVRRVMGNPNSLEARHVDFMDVIRQRNLASQLAVLVWREASWPFIPRLPQSAFDLVMGVQFHQAHLLNPGFALSPERLLGTRSISPLASKPNFALHISSHCGADSLRDEYLDHLEDILGIDKIVRMGKCTSTYPNGTKIHHTKEVAPPPLENERARIETFKFFLTFENEIQEGYVSEKLFAALTMNVVPVYYGAPDAPRITMEPSFIRVRDFANPHVLAKYLVHLSENENEYSKFHAWRYKPLHEAFDPKYVARVTEMLPGEAEIAMSITEEESTTLERRFPGGEWGARRATCCRLCDLQYLRSLVQPPEAREYVHQRWSKEKIIDKYFGGKKDRPRLG